MEGIVLEQSLSVGTWVKRQQLETLLQLSRATVCRRLSEWLKLGLIEKRGEGRPFDKRSEARPSFDKRPGEGRPFEKRNGKKPFVHKGKGR